MSGSDLAARGLASKSWARRRAMKRSRRREASLARVARPVQVATRPDDPLVRRGPGAGLMALLFVLLVVGALVLHGVVIVALFGLSSVLGSGVPTQEKVERLEVTIVEPPPPPEPVVEPEPEPEEKPEEEVEPEPEEKPEPEPEPIKKPKPKVEPKKPVAPPPDPVDKPKDPPPDPPAKPKRRIVGLNMESTVDGGDGPGFAAGNTRMGETDKRAEDPNKVEKIPPGDTAGTPGAKGGAAPEGPNKVSKRVPGTGGYSKPKLKSGGGTPPYPPALKRRGIEGDVIVRVSIGLDGRVTSVKIVKSSGQAAMDSAATANARQRVYTPATKGGKPIVESITYRVRFRLNDF